MTRLHFLIRGRVQGIGYRWFVRDSAGGLGVSGWVRNRADGSVEGEAEGAEEDLQRFVAMLRDGHPGARVEDIETRKVEAQGRKDDFDIRP